MHMYMNPVEGVKATICTINSHLTRLQQQLCGIRHLSFSLFFPPTNILLTLMTQNIMDSSSKPFCAQSLPRVSQSFKSFCLLFFTHMSLCVRKINKWHHEKSLGHLCVLLFPLRLIGVPALPCSARCWRRRSRTTLLWSCSAHQRCQVEDILFTSPNLLRTSLRSL